jgi:hypothetical protein
MLLVLWRGIVWSDLAPHRAPSSLRCRAHKEAIHLLQCVSLHSGMAVNAICQLGRLLCADGGTEPVSGCNCTQIIVKI